MRDMDCNRQLYWALAYAETRDSMRASKADRAVLLENVYRTFHSRGADPVALRYIYRALSQLKETSSESGMPLRVAQTRAAWSLLDAARSWIASRLSHGPVRSAIASLNRGKFVSDISDAVKALSTLRADFGQALPPVVNSDVFDAISTLDRIVSVQRSDDTELRRVMNILKRIDVNLDKIADMYSAGQER